MQTEHYLFESIHLNLFNKYIKLEKQTPHLSLTQKPSMETLNDDKM